MRITAAQLSNLVNGRLVGNPDAVCEGVATIEEAAPSDVTFVSDSRYEKKISETRAEVIIASKDYGMPSKTFVIVPNPLVALAEILEYVMSEKKKDKRFPPKGIHPSAVVSSHAIIGKDVTVGPCAVIEDGASIGEGSILGAGVFVGQDVSIGNFCVLHPNVVICERCVVGNNVVIHASSVIGSDGFGFIPLEKGIKKIPQTGIVRIGNNVEIGSNVSIDRATIGETVIGDETKIDNLVQIAHNVKVGSGCLITAQVGIAGSAIIGDGVVMGGQVGVKDHAKVGARAAIAAKAGVIGEIKSGEIVSGFPARAHSKTMRLYALTEKLPEILERIKKLEKTNK